MCHAIDGMLFGRLLSAIGAAATSLCCVLCMLFAVATPAAAVEPDEMLANATLEARARGISAGLRCLVCQNQSIDDSNAPLARDLRIIVRERLQAGDTDAQVVSFVVQRYGAFVLLRPPVTAATILLWIAPVLLLLTAGLLMTRHVARKPSFSGETAEHPPLSPEEARRLEAILQSKT